VSTHSIVLSCYRMNGRYEGIIFATSEALWGHASSVLNCIAAAVLTQ